MIGHYFIAALRNMVANRLQSAIAIIGLSIGITAALLAALFVRNQLSFNHFIPGYERTYLVVSELSTAGHPAHYIDFTNRNIAGLLKFNVSGLEGITRLMFSAPNKSDHRVELRQGDFTAKEIIYWAEPNLFEILPMRAVSGDLTTALQQPDGIVLSRTEARKYFGRESILGQTLFVDGYPMTVRAVIEDLPAGDTDLQSGIFASSLASFSSFASDKPDLPGSYTLSVRTYLRLKSEASVADVEKKMPALFAHLLPASFAGTTLTMSLLLIDKIPLFEGLHPGANLELEITSMVGLLILFIASIVFVSLLTAYAAHRAREVSLRKVCGAGRLSLIIQYLGESIITVFFATCLAVALSEWLLPVVNAFLDTGAETSYWRNPITLMALLGVVTVLGFLAGLYPAFVLSAFKPVEVFGGLLRHSPFADAIRKAMVIVQFATLTGLMIASAVVYQQYIYATRGVLRANINQVLVIRGRCNLAFLAEIQKLSGVIGASCTSRDFLDGSPNGGGVAWYRGKQLTIDFASIDRNTFALYGIRPIVSTRAPTSDYNVNKITGSAIILNETAVKWLGIASPQAAIGQALMFPRGPGMFHDLVSVPIVAVVPDFTFHSEQLIRPTVFRENSQTNNISVKLRTGETSETLDAIDRLWAGFNPGVPIDRVFLTDYIKQLNTSTLRQAQILGIFSGIAVFLSCLGMLGLAIFAAVKRTKEVGIRKSMGAGSIDLTRLLLWQFTKPILWANIIAWPIAWYVMHRWLNGFAYHVSLSPWIFVGATTLALVVALFTVAGQTWLVVRQKPVLALRYE